MVCRMLAGALIAFEMREGYSFPGAISNRARAGSISPEWDKGEDSRHRLSNVALAGRRTIVLVYNILAGVVIAFEMRRDSFPDAISNRARAGSGGSKCLHRKSSGR